MAALRAGPLREGRAVRHVRGRYSASEKLAENDLVRLGADMRLTRCEAMRCNTRCAREAGCGLRGRAAALLAHVARSLWFPRVPLRNCEPRCRWQPCPAGPAFSAAPIGGHRTTRLALMRAAARKLAVGRPATPKWRAKRPTCASTTA